MTDELTYHANSDTLDYNGEILKYNYWETYPEIEKHYHYWGYPTYTQFVKQVDNYKIAFNIVKLLLKKNLLNSRKLKDFIALVKEIAEELIK